eukprot:3383445-Pleurochrysis_carterae.AAC.1
MAIKNQVGRKRAEPIAKRFAHPTESQTHCEGRRNIKFTWSAVAAAQGEGASTKDKYGAVEPTSDKTGQTKMER